MTAKRLARSALLASLCVTLRYAFAPLPNIQPITAIFLALAVCAGWLESVAVMAITMVLTGFLLGVSPIIVGQIISYALILLLWARLLCPVIALFKKQEQLLQTVAAAALPMLYGFSISLYDSALHGFHFWAYWVRGLPFDGLHAVSTACFYPFILFIFRRTFNK